MPHPESPTETNTNQAKRRYLLPSLRPNFRGFKLINPFIANKAQGTEQEPVVYFNSLINMKMAVSVSNAEDLEITLGFLHERLDTSNMGITWSTSCP